MPQPKQIITFLISNDDCIKLLRNIDPFNKHTSTTAEYIRNAIPRQKYTLSLYHAESSLSSDIIMHIFPHPKPTAKQPTTKGSKYFIRQCAQTPGNNDWLTCAFVFNKNPKIYKVFVNLFKTGQLLDPD